MTDAALLAKFKRRAPLIATQEHLDKAMFTFPVEHHEEIAAQIQPLLTKEIIARKVDALPELKIKDPEAPTLQELTVQRLNNMAATIEELTARQKPLEDEVVVLKAEKEAHASTIAALINDRDSLKGERDALAVEVASLKAEPIKK